MIGILREDTAQILLHFSERPRGFVDHRAAVEQGKRVRESRQSPVVRPQRFSFPVFERVSL